MLSCYHCGHVWQGSEKVGRRESCAQCGADLHVCRNCRHYDRQAYNECHENQAERVLDKEKSNFCDFFDPAEKEAQSAKKKDSQDALKAQWDQLFKK